MQYCLIIIFAGRYQSVSEIFCMEIIVEDKQHLKLPLLDWCGQFWLLSNQIAKFFDHQYQYLQKQVMSNYFLHAVSHKEMVAYETNHTWLDVASCASCPIKLHDSLVINITGRNQLISLIFCMDILIKGRQHLRLPLFVGCSQV